MASLAEAAQESNGNNVDNTSSSATVIVPDTDTDMSTEAVRDTVRVSPEDVQPSVEDKMVALQQWWERHGASFSDWFSGLSAPEQLAALVSASPDMPAQSASERERRGQTLSASDLLLPELCTEGLLTSGGRLLVLLVARRCKSPDLCYSQDVLFLNTLRRQGLLPSLSNKAFEGMDSPFVDPLDPEENVRSLGPGTSTGTRQMVEEHLASGRLVDADVWLALRVRREAMAAFIVNFVEASQSATLPRPSPTYAALLRAEIVQQLAMAEMQSQGQGQELAQVAAPSQLVARPEQDSTANSNK